MKLYRSFATVGGLTLISRVFGFMRDILIAATLGSGWVADAFVVAFRFPNLFRRLFGEGAFNSAFVPLFAKKIEGEGKAAALGFAEEAMAGLFSILLILTVVAELTMPFLMYGLAPGFEAQPAKYDLAVLLTRITMPYLLCMSLVALMSGALNSAGRFVESSSVSIVLNGAMMVATSTMLGCMSNSVKPFPTKKLPWVWFSGAMSLTRMTGILIPSRPIFSTTLSKAFSKISMESVWLIFW